MISRFAGLGHWLLGIMVVAAATPAAGQSNLDAGKSPAQIFSDTCAACHRSPRELKPSNAGFLRDHYSTGGREAAAMAAYLAAVGSDPRAVQNRRPPGLGAREAAAPAEAASRPEHAGAPGAERAGSAGSDQAGTKPAPRRPSDSMELGKLPAAAAMVGEVEAAPSPAAAAPPLHPLEQFEE